MIEIIRKDGPNTADIHLVGKVTEIPNVTPDVGEKVWIQGKGHEIVSREFTYDFQGDGTLSLTRLTLEVKEV